MKTRSRKVSVSENLNPSDSKTKTGRIKKQINGNDNLSSSHVKTPLAEISNTPLDSWPLSNSNKISKMKYDKTDLENSDSPILGSRFKKIRQQALPKNLNGHVGVEANLSESFLNYQSPIIKTKKVVKPTICLDTNGKENESPKTRPVEEVKPLKRNLRSKKLNSPMISEPSPSTKTLHQSKIFEDPIMPKRVTRQTARTNLQSTKVSEVQSKLTDNLNTKDIAKNTSEKESSVKGTKQKNKTVGSRGQSTISANEEKPVGAIKRLPRKTASSSSSMESKLQRNVACVKKLCKSTKLLVI